MMGCKVNYSFSPTSGKTTSYKSISIKTFPNKAPLAPAKLSLDFTEALKDIFLNQSSLAVMPDGGELILEGYISAFDIAPVAFTSVETTANNRLTISVSVKHTNTSKEGKDFEVNLSRFADFAGSQDLSAVQNELMDDIVSQLVQDIFNKTLEDW